MIGGGQVVQGSTIGELMVVGSRSHQSINSNANHDNQTEKLMIKKFENKKK